jgi:hypothetical protein
MSRQDNTYEAVIQGDKAVVKMEDGWKSVSELASAAGGGGGGGVSPERFLARMVQNYRTPMTIALEMVGKLDKLQKTDDGYSADLSTDAAKLLLFPPRRQNAGGNGPEISNASASVKIWIKDGIVTKLENNVKGTVSFNGNDRDVDRTTTTEFKDVGSTTIKIPDEAKAKMDAPPATQP